MTGYKDGNYPEFKRVSDVLSKQGWTVLNPAENFGGRSDLPYDWYIREDLKLMAFAEAIVFLDGWDLSKGCLLELHAAWVLGMSIYKWNNYDELDTFVFFDPEHRLIRALIDRVFYKPVDEVLANMKEDEDENSD
jgi:hypothetical protein